MGWESKSKLDSIKMQRSTAAWWSMNERGGAATGAGTDNKNKLGKKRKKSILHQHENIVLSRIPGRAVFIDL